MSVGIVMLVHTALWRAARVARHWAESGCPVVIHVDKSVGRQDHQAFTQNLSDLPNIVFSPRGRCEWGAFSIVAATQAASELMLHGFPDVRHVCLTSGSCLPLRPVPELIDYLGERPRTDFIESATTRDVRWTVGGLDHERFTLHFPFSWKKRRALFDRYIRLQRLIGLRRRIAAGIAPHMGSQWWCLTRQTLSAILQDPERKTRDRYFKKVWIPDESYFQTLARLYSTNIESRSLTLAKFDTQGRPHVFYDDHLQLLRRSDCFVARKIWPGANRLYDAFLNGKATGERRGEPDPGRIGRILAKAVDRPVNRRPGLFMQARFPHGGPDTMPAAPPCSVFEGFAELLVNFEEWLSRATGACVHGHLFAPERAEFCGRQPFRPGAIPDSAALRDYNPRAFLTNLIWNTPAEHQCFQFGPRDTQDVSRDIAADPNARISVISGAWAVPLFHSNADFAHIRKRAAELQRIESRHLDILRASDRKARVQIRSMAEFLENPMKHLTEAIDGIGSRGRTHLTEAPRIADLEGFSQFLQNLKNQGMHPCLTGDFPIRPGMRAGPDAPRIPYIVGRKR